MAGEGAAAGEGVGLGVGAGVVFGGGEDTSSDCSYRVIMEKRKGTMVVTRLHIYWILIIFNSQILYVKPIQANFNLKWFNWNLFLRKEYNIALQTFTKQMI